MTGLADIWIGVLAGALVCAAIGVSIRLGLSPLTTALRSAPPGPRAFALFGVLTAPFLFGVSAACATALSAYGGGIDLVHHHCHVAAPGCVAHEPARATFMLAAAGAGLAAAAFVYVALTLTEHLLRTSNAFRLMKAASDEEDDRSARTLMTDTAVALAAGVFRPRLFVSRGLRERLSDDELDVVLAHESAHARRFDNLMRVVAASFVLGHWMRSIRVLRAELALAQEQACDQAAARAFGAVRTAETLLKVERLQAGGRMRGCLASAFVDGPVAARVRALLDPRFASSSVSVAVMVAAFAACLCVVMLSGEPLHHEIETWLLQMRD